MLAPQPRLEIGERCGEGLVELVLELDLLGHAEHRVPGEVEEQHAADERAAGCVVAHRMPGSMPFMLRIMRCRLPPFIIFIIFCICSNWLRRALTSWVVVPLPLAMRRRRLRAYIDRLADLARVKLRANFMAAQMRTYVKDHAYYLKSLISTTSLLTVPRTSASCLPSRDQLNRHTPFSLKSVNFFGGPPSSD